jgi:hypothetical protein
MSIYQVINHIGIANLFIQLLLGYITVCSSPSRQNVKLNVGTDTYNPVTRSYISIKNSGIATIRDRIKFF